LRPLSQRPDRRDDVIKQGPVVRGVGRLKNDAQLRALEQIGKTRSQRRPACKHAARCQPCEPKKETRPSFSAYSTFAASAFLSSHRHGQ
jgi:hypothetical protein